MNGFSALPTAPRKVAVFRALPGLGDMLCMVPALRALRAAWPKVHISLVGLPQAAFLRERFPNYVDELLEFPGFPGLPERTPPLAQLPAYFERMQAQHFDLLLQMHGSGHISNPLVMLFNAAATAGFYLPGQYCPDEALFIPYPDTLAEVRRHLQLVQHLGAVEQGEALEFPLQQTDRQALQAVPETAALRPGHYVCLHPGASVVERRWSPRYFARVADALARRGLSIVLTGSPGEAELTRQVQEAMQQPALNLAGKTDLGALAALFAQARLLICNDTGVSHLADALGTPSVVIFITTPPERWAPLDRELHRVVLHREVTNELELGRVAPASVTTALDQADELLSQEYAYATC